MPNIIVQPLQAPFLKLAPSAEAYALHKAALEWDLLDPIVLEGEADFKSKPKWVDLVTPYKHQVQNLITFCRRLPVTLLADDVGLGKTISAGLILSELIYRSRVSKVLIVCPKLLMPQWQEELKTKFGIDSELEVGSKLVTAANKLQKAEKGALITTYHSVRRYMDQLEAAGFHMLILDEAHKLRNLYGGNSSPEWATRIRQSLAARTFKYVLTLTATPIQNRLWDLYSLIDLLSVARGHPNPFGSEDSFARNYIADSHTSARQLKTHRKTEFRSIVYNYMSRVRRGDAQLTFPERIVRSHKVLPTESELKLFKLIAAPIQQLNGLAQVSIAKALVSSPQALASQLNNMAAKGTFPQDVADKVSVVVREMGITAKLSGLDSLLAQLRAERPRDWRLVIFTELRETQNAIGEYLDRLQVPCAFINGDSSIRNQDAIARFKTDPPRVNVIISTAAGAEGVNLQVANVLLNYDLPWNPMVVEQRVGRIQRLGSNHQNVIIFNAILQGTFEEKIVGRLMEKLQLASHAIGDIESLLEAAGLEEGEKESKFEDMLRRLVLASLAGKDVEKETELKAASIAQAKEELKREEKNINSLLGSMDSNQAQGPRAPKFSSQEKSMSAKDFVFNAFKQAGVVYREENPGVYVMSQLFRQNRFVFDEKGAAGLIHPPTIYTPGRPEFENLVSKHAKENECFVQGINAEIRVEARAACGGWVASFGGRFETARDTAVSNKFSGEAVLRVRVSMAHDSYEKLMELSCPVVDGVAQAAARELVNIAPQSLGIDLPALASEAAKDPDIVEFCRFYMERLSEELRSAAGDERRIKKLTEDFTPRLQPDLAGLKGSVKQVIQFETQFRLGDSPLYNCDMSIDNETGAVLSAPPLEVYGEGGARAPSTCFQACAVSGKRALRHLLIKSEDTAKYALPEHIVQCALTGKRVLSTEVATSDLSGRAVLISAMKISPINHKRGEPSYFGVCSFTGSDVLNTELEVSQVSGKSFRNDEAAVSAISLTRGHRNEFIRCQHTGKWLLPDEAERCDITGELVAPGILRQCEVTNKQVVPQLVGECAITHKRALLELLVTGSVSKVPMLKTKAVMSCLGNYCLPKEALSCAWSGRIYHPEDMGQCALTGLPVLRSYLFGQNPSLKALIDLLSKPSSELKVAIDTAPVLAALTSVIGAGNYTVVGVTKAPESDSAAIIVDSKKIFGLVKRRHGFVYSVNEGKILGKVTTGKLSNGVWVRNI